MATLFKTVVLMSGALIGCGAGTVERNKPARGSGMAPASDGNSDASTPTQDAPTTPDTQPGTQPTTSTAPTTPDAEVSTPTPSSEPSTDPSAEPSTEPAAPPLIVLPEPSATASPSPVATEQLECPSEDWTCGAAGCGHDSSFTCRNGTFCAFPPAEPCSCMPTPAPETCPDGEVRTCLFGQFGPTDNSVALRFDCACLPRQESCEATCDQRENGIGSYRGCREVNNVVECGGCIYAGILR